MGNVNRNRIGRIAGIMAVLGALVGAGTVRGNNASGPATNNAAAVARGKTLFQQKCSVCHYDTSDQKKIGPGLKGLSKRGTFTVNGNKITDDSLKTWIENGDQLMPPFKDVIAYVKTL